MNKAILMLAALGAGVATYVAAIRPRIIRWDATDDEVRRSLPGDELTPDARLVSTHAITINASAGEIWPWIVQIGNGRAGWYSYRTIERLVHDGKLRDEGASRRILPEFQHLQIGDFIPVGNGAFQVADMKPEHYLILQPAFEMMSRERFDPNEPTSGTPDRSNAGFNFILEPIDAQTTRLIARVRLTSKSLLETLLMCGFMEPGHFIMQTKMLRGIKQRVEANHRTESA
jgi:hypothetical protein